MKQIHGYKVKGSDGKSAMLYFSAPQKSDGFNESEMLDLTSKDVVKDNVASHTAKHWVGYLRTEFKAAPKDVRQKFYASNRKVSFAAAVADSADEMNKLITRARGVDIPADQAEKVLAMYASYYEQLKTALSPRVKANTPAVTKSDRLARFAHLFATR